MNTTPWHEADDFWETLGPVFFEAARWETAPGEAEQVIRLLGAVPGAAILDLCCGPGRHSLELARQGYQVTGVDRTASFLQIARGEAGDLPIEWVQDDMRRFCRPGAYAGVLNLCSSFGYFDDQADDRLALDNMHRSLQPGGTLVMEMIGKEVMARSPLSRNWIEWEGGFLLESSQVEQDWGWLRNRWIVITQDGIGEFLWGHRLYAASDLTGLLREAGFIDVNIYGDMGAAPYNQSASRLVAVARKTQ